MFADSRDFFCGKCQQLKFPGFPGTVFSGKKLYLQDKGPELESHARQLHQKQILKHISLSGFFSAVFWRKLSEKNNITMKVSQVKLLKSTLS